MNEAKNSNVACLTNHTAKDPTDNMELWMYGVIIPCMAIPGIFMNLTSTVVFTRRNLRSSMHMYLAGLGFFDFVLLFSVMSLYPMLAYCIHLDLHSLTAFTCRVLSYSSLICYPITLIAHFCSVWTCVALTVDRFLAVVFPLKKRIYCTVNNSFKVLLIITTAGVLYCVPTMFEVRLDSSGSPMRTEFRLSKSYSLIYKAYGNLIIFLITPWLIMIILNAIVIRSIRKAARNRDIISAKISRISSSSRRVTESEGKSTKITILVTFLFLICNLPAGINGYETAELTKPQLVSCQLDYVLRRFMVFLGNGLVCLNSLLNFLVYCTVRKKFRRMVLEILLFKPRIPDQEWLSLTMRSRSRTLMERTGATPVEQFVEVKTPFL